MLPRRREGGLALPGCRLQNGRWSVIGAVSLACVLETMQASVDDDGNRMFTSSVIENLFQRAVEGIP